ncbi:MAG: hypothetical protein HOQ24_14330 [Mycobacteriaceae bacterium]|nr:hypothetical protein [Mycobacteriaceae bacterium]
MVLRLDPDEFKRQAPTFAKASQDLHTALQQLIQAVKDEGDCWGGDDPGKAFANGPEGNNGYVSDLNDGLQHLAGLVTLMDQVGKNIVSTGNAVQQQDIDNATGLPRAD